MEKVITKRSRTKQAWKGSYRVIH